MCLSVIRLFFCRNLAFRKEQALSPGRNLFAGDAPIYQQPDGSFVASDILHGGSGVGSNKDPRDLERVSGRHVLDRQMGAADAEWLLGAPQMG